MTCEDELHEARQQIKSLMRALAAVITVAGGEVEVPDSTLVGLDKDVEIEAEQSPIKQSHTVRVRK